MDFDEAMATALSIAKLTADKELKENLEDCIDVSKYNYKQLCDAFQTTMNYTLITYGNNTRIEAQMIETRDFCDEIINSSTNQVFSLLYVCIVLFSIFFLRK